MSDARTHRQVILNGFLIAIIAIALGAEFTAPTASATSSASSVRADAVSTVSSPKKTQAGGRKSKFRDQIAFLDSANIVASRFFAPIHAPIIWKR